MLSSLVRGLGVLGGCGSVSGMFSLVINATLAIALCALEL